MQVSILCYDICQYVNLGLATKVLHMWSVHSYHVIPLYPHQLAPPKPQTLCSSHNQPPAESRDQISCFELLPTTIPKTQLLKMSSLATVGIISIGEMGMGVAKLLIAHNYRVVTNIEGRRLVVLSLMNYVINYQFRKDTTSLAGKIGFQNQFSSQKDRFSEGGETNNVIWNEMRTASMLNEGDFIYCTL